MEVCKSLLLLPAKTLSTAGFYNMKASHYWLFPNLMFRLSHADLNETHPGKFVLVENVICEM